MLLELGLTPKTIKTLKYEKDRVNKILQYEIRRKVKNSKNK